MNIGKAFSFVFEDKEWIQKIAIAAVILLVDRCPPLISPIRPRAAGRVYGEIIRHAAAKPGAAKWDNWGPLADGLKALAITWSTSRHDHPIAVPVNPDRRLGRSRRPARV
jgi:hypothetical protein